MYVFSCDYTCAIFFLQVQPCRLLLPPPFFEVGASSQVGGEQTEDQDLDTAADKLHNEEEKEMKKQ